MTTRFRDEIMIISQESHQPLRQGEIRGVDDSPDGIVYLVKWSDADHETLLRAGPDVVIKHQRGRGSDAGATSWLSRWLSRLRHPLEWSHLRNLERIYEACDQELAWSVQDVLAGLGLTQSDYSIGGGKILRFPVVEWVDAGPPIRLFIHILPGQTSEDYKAHEQAIADDLDMAKARVVGLRHSRIRLELQPRN